MPLFFYRARNAMSKPEEGTIEALSLQHARDLLKTRGIFTEEIHEATMHDRSIKQTVASSEPLAPQSSSQMSGVGSESSIYFPISDTLRLYAGWLLAWYGLIFAIGAYQHRGILPFKSDLIAGLAVSPIVLSTACGVFLFLMLSSLHKTISGGLLKGITLTGIWILGTVWFIINI